MVSKQIFSCDCVWVCMILWSYSIKFTQTYYRCSWNSHTAANRFSVMIGGCPSSAHGNCLMTSLTSPASRSQASSTCHVPLMSIYIFNLSSNEWICESNSSQFLCQNRFLWLCTFSVITQWTPSEKLNHWINNWIWPVSDKKVICGFLWKNSTQGQHFQKE